MSGELCNTEAMLIAALDYLEEEGQCPNFIFSGDSVLHLAAFNAFAMMMDDRGVDLCGVILNSIPQHRLPQFGPEDIIGVAASDYVYLQNGVDCAVAKRSAINKTYELLFNPVGNPSARKKERSSDCFYLIAPNMGIPGLHYWRAAFSRKRPVVCVLLEEGTSAYLPRESALAFASLRIAGHNDLLSKAKRVAKKPLDHRREAKLRKIASFKRFTAFEEGRCGLVRNEEFARWFVESLSKQARRKVVDGVDFSGKVLVLGTNFQELGPDSLEARVIAEVAEAIRACGLTPLLRPHPRSVNATYYKSLGIPVDDSGRVPAELLLAASSTLPVAIVGFCSSTQVLANTLWGIPCFTIRGILGSNAKRLDLFSPVIEGYVERLRMFDATFADCFIPVGSGSELAEALGNLAGEEN